MGRWRWGALCVLALSAAQPDELYRQGVALFEQGKLSEASRVLREASLLAPRNAQVWKALGVAFAAVQDYEAAAPAFEQACRIAPSLPDACYYYGRALYALNRFTPAIDPLKQALRADAKDWRAYAALGQAYEALSNSREAEECFAAAMRLYLAPGATRAGGEDPRIAWGVFLIRQGKLTEAVAPLKAAAQANPKAARAQFELGRALYQTGQTEQAIRRLQAAVDAQYGSAAHLLLGKALLRAGREDEARKHLALGDQ